MRGGGRGFVVSTFATLAIAACGRMLPDGGEDAPARTTGGDASTADETSAIAVDASGASDGAPNVAVDADAGCTRVFTETFTQPHASPWLETETGGFVTHEPDAGAAAPGALRAVVSSIGQSTAAQISRQTNGLPKSATLAFAMRIPEMTSEYFEVGCTLQLKSDEQTFVSFEPEVSANVLRFDSTKKNGGSTVSTGSATVTGAVDGAHWYAVSVSVTGITAAGADVIARVDGTPHYDRSVIFPAPPTAIRVKCGIDYGAPGGAATVHVDDVTLDTCP
jgi:hypothetical protein